ncbi:glycoside hydrolase family 66 protein [Cucumibacter marinus]|uniref:glycoside hydrolase family 66 protein n=1 Tax=Cucumibacter marinus TaxID=1121252 RepID=UPI00042436D8|nr:glycoside hydrolase family 66 protein [Cucumibacter marinus]
MPKPELLPARAVNAAHTPIIVEVRGEGAPGTVRVTLLGETVHTQDHEGGGTIRIPGLEPGGYAVELDTGGTTLRTALAVGEDADRMRYGFVASYAPNKDCAGVADLVRRLHLTDIQFYDWAYRHADLLGGGEDYRDALDQPISLATVRALISAVGEAGARALGYAAVYAAGPDEWPQWQTLGLKNAAGEFYGLGDFLFILDPAAPAWLEHFGADLAAAHELGFDGFHLDQYGYPKRAVREDGAVIDVTESFCTMIAAVREKLPAARLVFNNVNDFPTRATAATPQDAIYIEVWEPQLALGDLARTVERARSFDPQKPVVIAAYQHVYDTAPAEAADTATALTMATLFSHGATQLLAGEADRLLVDPYYVRNHVMAPSTEALLKRWYDFLVAHDALLMPRAITDVTNSHAGEYNGDLEVKFPDAAVSGDPMAGHVWRRITRTPEGLVVHLINLADQADTLWDAARQTVTQLAGGVLDYRCAGPNPPRISVADPDAEGRLIEIDVEISGARASAKLPPLQTWMVILIRD